MAITTTFPDPAPENCVELPWHPKGHPETRLTKRSAAVLNWFDEVQADQVEGYGGDIPTHLMIQLLNRIGEK